jgi:2,6-dihydroxypyridine 3-monooxygenase
MTDMPSVAVIGGSLGGLTAALVLRDIGCEVTVYERSSSALQARGAGIAVLPETLRYPVERLGIPAKQICSSTDVIRFLDRAGNIDHELDHPYLFSSWNIIYRTLQSGLDADRYMLGRGMNSFVSDPDGVTVEFDDGDQVRVDLLVCADGINSISRGTLLPDVRPRYAGYVAWRGVVDESALDDATRSALYDALTYQLLPGSHILLYPIPGLDGALESGQRLMNMVWYRNVAEDDLPELLTDRTGKQRSVSLPPGAARDEVVDEMRSFAAEHLAPPIAAMVTGVGEPFVQAVFDIDVAKMAFGRVCLIGDAAFVVRPHAAAGTAKAAEDGWVLADELERSGGDVGVALERWEAAQLALGRALLDRTRDIGDSSQFTSKFRAGDPRLIFGLHGPGC